MKTKNITNRKHFYSGLLSTALIMLVVVGCVYLDSVSIMQLQDDGTNAPVAKAGSVATFLVNGNINCQEDHGDVQFIVSFLAPKSWNVRQNAQVTYKTTLHTNPDEELPMAVVPESSLPKNGGGRSWGEALMQDYGVGPNVLSDMEWVTFVTVDKWSIFNGDKPKYNIFIRTNVGELNLKAYLGFFVNHTDDGISSGNDHKKVKFSDEVFEVVDGKGLTIDYANEHFNKVQPLASLQDDFITFSFNGGITDNELSKADEVYFEATAYDSNHLPLGSVSEKSSKTLMRRESAFNEVRNLTFWPVDFFGIPAGTQIDYIEYVFTNKDRSIVVTQSDDDFAVNGTVITEPKMPFVFSLLCD